MKKILCLASMSISMLAVVTISSCSEHNTVTSDLESGATSLTRVPVYNSQQIIVLTYSDYLKNQLARLRVGDSYVWSSDNPSVVTVDQKGLATGVVTGTANVQVKRLYSGNVEQESETIAVTVTNVIPIPDSRFKAYLIEKVNIDKNGNNEIEPSEAMAFNGEIDVKNDTLIKSLDGLRFFKNLKRLNCSNTRISYLDVSSNTELESLDCSQCNELICSTTERKLANMLDLTQNLRLTAVDCSQTEKLKTIAILIGTEKRTETWKKDKGDRFALVGVWRI